MQLNLHRGWCVCTAGTNIANATKEKARDVPGLWVQEEAGPIKWIRPESKATSEDGQLAVLTTSAFTAFNVSFEFTLGLPCSDTPVCEFEVWGTAAFVFGATDSQHFKMLEFPCKIPAAIYIEIRRQES